MWLLVMLSVYLASLLITLVNRTNTVNRKNTLTIRFFTVTQVVHENNGVMQMSKEIRAGIKENQYVALELAAHAVGLTVSAFCRAAALKEAAKMGYHAEQPQVD